MTAVSSIQNQYVADALKYINGAEVTHSSIVDDAKGAIGAVPANAAIMGTFYTTGRLLKGTNKELFTIFGHTFHGRAGITGKFGLIDTTKNMYSTMTDKTVTNLLTKGDGISGALRNSEIIDAVKVLSKSKEKDEILKIISDAKKSGDDVVKVLQDKAGTALKENSFMSKKLKQVSSWVWGKVPQGAKSWITGKAAKLGSIKLGSSATSKTLGEIVKSGSGKFSKAFKTSGAGFMMAIDGAMALFTDVVPAFSEGGIGEGLKQTGKSAVKVGASAAGWAVGATLGKAAFTALGTLIGGPVGGFIGGAIGTFVGDMVGGTIGSAIAGKVTEKIVGEDYTDKVQNEQIAGQAIMIANDSAAMNELNQTVYALVQQDMADDGKLSKDSKKMLEYLENGAGNVSTAANLAFTGNTTNYDVSNPYANEQTNYNASDLNTLIARIQAGDTSVYDVPADILQKSANSSYASMTEGFANNYTNFGYQNPYANTNIGANGIYNYYAEA